MAKGRLSGILNSLFGAGRRGGNRVRLDAATSTHTPVRAVEQAKVLSEDEGLFGKVYILSLAEFYDAIGGRDGRLADSLFVICDTVFGARTGPGDGFARVGDDRYVFRFGGLDDRRSLIRATAIIEDIGTKLLGEHFIKSGRFKAMLTAVGVGDLIGKDGDIDPARIDAALAAADALPPVPAAAEEPAWVRFSQAGRVDGGGWMAVPGGQGRPPQWSSLAYTPKKQEIRWEAIEPPKKKGDDLRWEELRRERRKDEAAPAWHPLVRDKKE
jgi:hypothetical protein